LIRFLAKGLWRDRSRSRFPTLVVTAGVMLTVVLYSYIKGSENDIVRTSACFRSGHVDIVSRAYADEEDQLPNDLALAGVGGLLAELRTTRPELIWTPRISFAGLLDVPDAAGETRAQGPTVGLAVELAAPDSPEPGILGLERALVRGHLPQQAGEILVSELFAQRLDLAPGDVATLISSTMYGALATANFTVAGTLRFGVSALDRGFVMADVADIQRALDMDDMAGAVLGYYPDHVFRPDAARTLAAGFNARYADSDDPFAPLMRTLREHEGLGEALDLANMIGGAIVALFVVVMSIVLWNAGLMSGLRRYGEFGVRLAIGEGKGHLYRSLLAESLLIGHVGSVLGTALGLGISRYLEVQGMDISAFLKNSSMMISDVLHARITPVSWFIGLVPGLVATLLGTAMAGRGIYGRETAKLTKELQE
jgi:putative ABC transport system permease protein